MRGMLAVVGWQKNFCKVEFVPNSLRKQIINIFVEKCSVLLEGNFGLWLHYSIAGKQRRGFCSKHLPFRNFQLLELVVSPVLSI